jgi:hypothetical protein
VPGNGLLRSSLGHADGTRHAAVSGSRPGEPTDHQEHSMRHRTLVPLAALTLAAAALAGCGSSSGTGLNSTCNSFLAQSASDQLHDAQLWANPIRNGSTSPLGDAAASSAREQLAAYCQQAGHGGDRLKNLDYSFR